MSDDSPDVLLFHVESSSTKGRLARITLLAEISESKVGVFDDVLKRLKGTPLRLGAVAAFEDDAVDLLIERHAKEVADLTRKLTEQEERNQRLEQHISFTRAEVRGLQEQLGFKLP